MTFDQKVHEFIRWLSISRVKDSDLVEMKLRQLFETKPLEISIIECKLSCHCCSAPIPDTHPAFRGLRGNEVASIRAEIVSLRECKKTPGTETRILLLKHRLIELNAEMPWGEKMP